MCILSDGMEKDFQKVKNNENKKLKVMVKLLNLALIFNLFKKCRALIKITTK